VRTPPLNEWDKRHGASELPQLWHVYLLDVEQMVQRRNPHEHQHEERHHADDEVGHQPPLLVEPFRVLHRAFFLETDVQIVADEAGHQREDQDQFQLIANDEHAEEQREAGGVEEHAYQQLLLGVVLERAAIGGGGGGVADGAILGKALAGHEERSDHPVSDQQRHRRHLPGRQREPAEQQPDRVVDRLAQHVQVGQFLGADRRDVVDQSHHQQERSGVEERLAQYRRHRQAKDAEKYPFRVGEGWLDLPGRDG